VTKPLDEIVTKLKELSDDNGLINSRTLYALRKKEAGDLIEKYMSEGKAPGTWDKTLAAGLLRDVQKAIDDEIIGAGGQGWDKYLEIYSHGMRNLDKYKERIELAKNPLQKTNLGGGTDMSAEARPLSPNMLWRPAMATNAIMRTLAKRLEPKADAYAAQILLDPAEFAKALSQVPLTKRSGLIEAWNQSRNSLLGSMAAEQNGLLSTK
jgi:hypothetical protein